jgi:lipase
VTAARVLLVHGLVHACGHLGAHHRASPDVAFLVPDLPGYGGNDAGSASSVPRAVACVADRIRAWAPGAVDLVGHSLGGAVVMALALRHPELVRSIVNVEGNFTLEDAFWSRGIAEGTEEQAAAWLASRRADVEGWLVEQGIDPTHEAVDAATRSLRAQSGRTLRSMARSVVEVTADPAYLEGVRRVLSRGTPLHLVAGERSVAGWDVPDFVRAAAATSTVLRGVGHMMMLEDPAGFMEAVRRTLSY